MTLFRRNLSALAALLAATAVAASVGCRTHDLSSHLCRPVCFGCDDYCPKPDPPVCQCRPCKKCVGH